MITTPLRRRFFDLSDEMLADIDRQLERLVEQLQRTVDAVDRLVPETPELAPLLRSLGDALKTQGVRDEEIVAQPVVRGKQYSVIPLSLTFRGGFPQAFAAIKRVEEIRAVKLD